MTTEMMSLFDLIQGWSPVVLAVFLRVGAVMAVMPGFGEQVIPQRIRLILTMAFTAIVVPLVEPEISTYVDLHGSVSYYLIFEVLAGLILGISLRMFVFALQVAGTIAAQSTSLAQIFGSAGMDPQPAVGHLLLYGGLCLAAISGLHVKVAVAITSSYDFLPIGGVYSGWVAEWGIQRVSHAFSLGFSLAAPFVIAAFVYNVALGIINKAMPQLMVSMVGAPAVTLGSILIMFVGLPYILSIWWSDFSAFLFSPLGASR